ncbi:unnamed protein product [Schistosoma turkestanicum]|nr:unnamed protein product [Schistosoma turkestanicum]
MNEYSKIEKIRIYIGTWNVNGRNDANATIQLDNWLKSSDDDQPPADIYVFGLISSERKPHLKLIKTS